MDVIGFYKNCSHSEAIFSDVYNSWVFIHRERMSAGSGETLMNIEGKNRSRYGNIFVEGNEVEDWGTGKIESRY